MSATHTEDSARRSLTYQLPSILDPLNLARVFPAQQPVEVELGSGDGSFLLEWASAHRNRNYIGVERLLGRLEKMGRKGRRAGLENLAGVRIESSYFLKYLLPRDSVAALHIYFPDPWPKRKHWAHRLINEDFPALAAGILEPGARVYLRTDDEEYFQQMVRVFAASTMFRLTETPLELSATLTDFEKDFNARGIKTLRAAYQKG